MRANASGYPKVTLDGSIEMLADWFNAQGQGDVDRG
jgi:hypothetical protein